MNDSCEIVEKLISEDLPKKKIDVVNWVDFSLRDLGFSIFHGQRLNQAHRVDGDIPFITAGSENRGLKQYIATDRTVYSNPITVDMFGNCFYQPYACCGDDNVYFFVNDQSHICRKCLWQLALILKLSINIATESSFARPMRIL